MPQYKQSFDPHKGPHLDVFLSKPLSIYGEDEAESSKRKLNMLIDTGASKTAINSKIARDMGLEIAGKETVRLANGEVKTNLYHADVTCELFFPVLYLPDLRVIEFNLADGWRDGFLGRDFLEKITIEINSPEKYFKIIV